MQKIFFYGLFMDKSLLTDQGFHPELIGPAALPNYRIQIGERATLLPSASKQAFGIVMALSDQEASALYAEPSVRAYQPEPVQVILLKNNQTIKVDCYNLPRELALTGTNPAYAKKLAKLAESLGFNPNYTQEIAAFGLDA